MSLIVLTLALITAMIMVVLAAIYGWHQYERMQARRSPLTRTVHRLPGYGLYRRIEDLNDNLCACFLMMMVTPMVALGGWSFASWSNSSDYSPKGLGVAIIIAGVTSGLLLVLLIRGLRKRSRYKEGFYAELATAAELDRLKAHGFAVYHDIQAPNFNIDHVVVGSSGVFAIETKSRRKPKRGKDSARVQFDGELLHFPDWKDRKPVEQALAQARWLQDYLFRETGLRVPVRPVLSLPGWYVINGAKRSAVTVINPANCISHFNEGVRLGDSDIRLIQRQIEKLCAIDTRPAWEKNRDAQTQMG